MFRFAAAAFGEAPERAPADAAPERAGRLLQLPGAEGLGECYAVSILVLVRHCLDCYVVLLLLDNYEPEKSLL